MNKVKKVKIAFNNQINKSVKFFEDTHEYKLYNGVSYEKKLLSGTQFISKFFPKFDKSIAKYVAKRDGKTEQQVLDEWSQKGKEASEFGTAIHYFAECYIKKEKVPLPKNEKEENYFNVVKQFIIELFNKGWELVEAEKIVFNNNIAGTIDLVMINHDKKEYGIFDWKTNKKIEFHSYDKNTYAFPPIDFLQDCNYNKYSLQLGLYTRLLRSELKYDYKIVNTIFHIQEKEVVSIYPRQEIDFEHYSKLMEQKLFNRRAR